MLAMPFLFENGSAQHGVPERECVAAPVARQDLEDVPKDPISDDPTI